MRSETRQRTCLVGVRLTPEEHARAQALADARGVTIPDLIRRLLLELGQDTRMSRRRAGLVERLAIELRLMDCEDAGETNPQIERSWGLSEWYRDCYRKDARRILALIKKFEEPDSPASS